MTGVRILPRRSRFATAAEDWLRKHSTGESVSTSDLWKGISQAHPDLTTPTERRKTPKATCMRDLRHDAAFTLGQGKIRLSELRVD